MGRWRGRKRNWKKNNGEAAATTNNGVDTITNNSSSSSGGSRPKNNVFTVAQQRQVRTYLQSYRKLAEQSFHGEQLLQSPTVIPNNNNNGVTTTMIADILFPTLTNLIVSARYLALPMELSSKRRRFIHELCVDVGLYHAAVGATRDTRILIVSVYADGFEHVVGLLEHPLALEMHRYRPWYVVVVAAAVAAAAAQGLLDKNASNAGVDADESAVVDAVAMKTANGNNNNSNSNSSVNTFVDREKLARAAIAQLIDHPGRCLRNDTDDIDFLALQDDDLADVIAPAVDADLKKWTLVDTATKMRDCVAELIAAAPTEIALDVESYNVSKYTQLTCLLQVTSNSGTTSAGHYHHKEYVIDTLADGVWDEVGGLAPLFADPAIIKIGHSIGGLDVRSLHRDFGIFIVNAFDTYEASRILKLKHHGLAAVCKHYGMANVEVYEQLKAEYQSSDWRIRPLTGPMIQYGRYDIHYLIKLRTLMIRDLTRSELWDKTIATEATESIFASDALSATLKHIEQQEGDVFMDENSDDDDFKSTRMISRADSGISSEYHTPDSSRSLDYSETVDSSRVSTVGAKDLRLQPRLMTVISRSQDRCKDLWSDRKEPHLKNSVFMNMVGRGKRNEIDWDASNITLYDDLVQWRNQVASELECLAGFVAPLDLLAEIAHKRPVNEAGLRKITHFLPQVLENSSSGHREQLCEIVRLSLGEAKVEETTLYYADRKEVLQGQERGIDLPAEGGASPMLKVAVAVAIGAGVAVAVAVAKKRRTK